MTYTSSPRSAQTLKSRKDRYIPRSEGVSRSATSPLPTLSDPTFPFSMMSPLTSLKENVSLSLAPLVLANRPLLLCYNGFMSPALGQSLWATLR